MQQDSEEDPQYVWSSPQAVNRDGVDKMAADSVGKCGSQECQWMTTDGY